MHYTDVDSTAVVFVSAGLLCLAVVYVFDNIKVGQYGYFGRGRSIKLVGSTVTACDRLGAQMDAGFVVFAMLTLLGWLAIGTAIVGVKLTSVSASANRVHTTCIPSTAVAILGLGTLVTALLTASSPPEQEDVLQQHTCGLDRAARILLFAFATQGVGFFLLAYAAVWHVDDAHVQAFCAAFIAMVCAFIDASSRVTGKAIPGWPVVVTVQLGALAVLTATACIYPSY